MDLLGSIMSSMDKPPSLTNKQKEILKRQKEELEKRKNEDREKLKTFKKQIEETLEKHFKDPYNYDLKFEPMEKIYRTLIHDVAEAYGFISYGFGEDGVDRHVRVYRKENPPCEYELAARRKGEPWNDEIKQEVMEKVEQEKRRQAEERRKRLNENEKDDFQPNKNYKDKYKHLIGDESAAPLEVTKVMNKSYGFVPSENKKDVRSIEQTMADIQAKKRLKTTHQNSTNN